eukprot:TRINITY_DN2633_c0_g4_i1.p1 TRINITY_DN2633_c0_g4~~TRINITY_DN2633_c0_g4_i1.p1  ORF type:complete len:467 (+),score=95.44 TRINITY_DN2633_c0_g4_i1:84-1484(+)
MWRPQPMLGCVLLSAAASAVVFGEDECIGYNGSSCEDCTDERVAPCPERCEGGPCPSSCDADCVAPEGGRRAEPERQERCRCRRYSCDGSCDQSCDASCDDGCGSDGTCDEGCDDGCDSGCDDCDACAGTECMPNCHCQSSEIFTCECHGASCDASCDAGCDRLCPPGWPCRRLACDEDCDAGCDECGGECTADCVCPPPTVSPIASPTAAPSASTYAPLPSVGDLLGLLGLNFGSGVRPQIISGSVTGSAAAYPGCPDLVADPASVQCQCSIINSSTVPFTDVAHTYCPGTMPSTWTGAVHFSCPHSFAAGTQFNISCPNSWPACDIYLLVYHCPGCGSAAFNGGWVQNLGNEWSGRHCAPKFCQDGDQGPQHNMISYNMQVQGGGKVDLPETTTSKSHYFSIVVKGIPSTCASHTNSAACSAAHGGGGSCVWDNGACLSGFCPPVPADGSMCGAPCPPQDAADG